MLSRKSFKSVVVIAMVMAMGQVEARQQEDEIAAEMQRVEAQLAQQESKSTAERREAEVQIEEAARQMERAVREHEVVRRSYSDGRIEVEVRMREAEQALATAAQEMAQLSMRQLPRVAVVERIVRANQGPVLGVTIGPNNDGEPVEGVAVIGVSPGGAAADAGLRAGDVIISINDESLSADNSDQANEKLLDFMQGVEEGDELTIGYLRNGKSATVDLAPRSMGTESFSFNFESDVNVPQVHVAPHAGMMNRFLWVTQSGGFGDMELVKLTDELGSYFGTSDGLLVVRAPENEALKLMDGDVIQSIDGREPTSASHAMRILGSYEGGETLKIGIMREKRKQTISIEVPEGSPNATPIAPLVAPSAQTVPRPPVVVFEKESI